MPYLLSPYHVFSYSFELSKKKNTGVSPFGEEQVLKIPTYETRDECEDCRTSIVITKVHFHVQVLSTPISMALGEFKITSVR
jgi:hypothetical protein